VEEEVGGVSGRERRTVRAPLGAGGKQIQRNKSPRGIPPLTTFPEWRSPAVSPPPVAVWETEEVREGLLNLAVDFFL
jgi:hypothetical protein